MEIEAVYQRYFPILREKCRRMILDSDEAQDLAQETFIRLWKNADQLQDPRATVAWLYKTSTRLAIDRIRRQKVRSLIHTEDLRRSVHGGLEFDPEAKLNASQILTQIATLLSADELTIGILRWVDGLEQQEIAEVLGVHERTIRRRLRRAETTIQQAFGETAT